MLGDELIWKDNAELKNCIYYAAIDCTLEFNENEKFDEFDLEIDMLSKITIWTTNRKSTENRKNFWLEYLQLLSVATKFFFFSSKLLTWLIKNEWNNAGTDSDYLTTSLQKCCRQNAIDFLFQNLEFNYEHLWENTIDWDSRGQLLSDWIWSKWCCR